MFYQQIECYRSVNLDPGNCQILPQLKTKIDFENLAIEENLLVQAKEIYDNFVMRELLIRQRKRSDCSRKAEGRFDTFFIILFMKFMILKYPKDKKSNS